MESSIIGEVDVLIVGGGFQGVCLLHHAIQNGLQAILITKESYLGDGESLHGHEFVNFGSLGAHVENMNIVKEGWKELIAAFPVKEAPIPVLRATITNNLESPAFEESVLKRWKQFDLEHEKQQFPTIFQGGFSNPSNVVYYKAADKMTDWRIALLAVYEPYKDRVRQGTLSNIQLNSDKSIDYVEVNTPKNTGVRIRAHNIMLATGAWTVPLLRSIKAKNPTVFSEKAELKCMVKTLNMFCVKGNMKDLPSLSSFHIGFPKNGGILCMECNDEVIWYISTFDYPDPTPEVLLGLNDKEMSFDPNKEVPINQIKLQSAVDLLATFCPQIFKIHSLQYGIYFGAKHDHPVDGPTIVPRSMVIDSNFGLGQHVTAVFPITWGNCFLAGKRAVQYLIDSGKVKKVDRPSVPSFIEQLPPVTGVGKKKHETLEFFSISEFVKTYGVKVPFSQ